MTLPNKVVTDFLLRLYTRGKKYCYHRLAFQLPSPSPSPFMSSFIYFVFFFFPFFRILFHLPLHGFLHIKSLVPSSPPSSCHSPPSVSFPRHYISSSFTPFLQCLLHQPRSKLPSISTLSYPSHPPLPSWHPSSLQFSHLLHPSFTASFIIHTSPSSPPPSAFPTISFAHPSTLLHPSFSFPSKPTQRPSRQSHVFHLGRLHTWRSPLDLPANERHVAKCIHLSGSEGHT